MEQLEQKQKQQQQQEQQMEQQQTEQLLPQQHETAGEETAAAAAAVNGNVAVEGPLQRMVRELLQRQTDMSLLAESLKCLNTHGWLPQQPQPPAAAAAATAATPVSLSLFVRRQRLEVYRQQLQAFRQVSPLLHQLQQAAETLNSTFNAAISRLAKGRQHLLPLLQQLLQLRQQQQQITDKERLCKTILDRLSVPQQTLEALTRPLPTQAAAAEVAAAASGEQQGDALYWELRDTRRALGEVQQKRQRLQEASAAAAADYPLLESLLRQTQELSDSGYERLFLLVLLRLQHLAAAAAATPASSSSADPLGVSFQALIGLAQQQLVLQKQAMLHQQTALAASAGARAEGEEEGPSKEGLGRDTVLWEALADLHGRPAYLLQCMQQLLRLRRQLLQQHFAAATWGPLEFAGAWEAPRPLKNALGWVSRAATEEAAVFVSVLQLLFSRGGPAALGLQQQEEQEEQQPQPHAAEAPGNLGRLQFSPASAVEAEGGASEEPPMLVQQQPQHQQEQQHQQQQQQQQNRGWLPLSEAATLPSEAGGNAATLKQLLDPLALIDGALEALQGPLAARLSKAFAVHSSSSRGSSGITALKEALLLQQEAANIEQTLAAAVQEAPQQRLERQQQEQQQQQQQQQRRPLLVSFLLDLAEESLGNFESQWDASALQLPQLSAAAAAEWVPAASGAARSSSLPSFLILFAARLQDLLLAHAACLSPYQQQQQQQQQQDEEMSPLQRLQALIGRDVPRAVNYCLQGAHLMGAPQGCVFVINALCCLRSALQPHIVSLPQELQQQQQQQERQQQQQQLLQQLLALPVLQQQRQLLTQLIEEKTEQLGTLEGTRLCASLGLKVMLEALHSLKGEGARGDAQGVSMPSEVAAGLLKEEKMNDFFSSFMSEVYGASSVEMPLLGALTQGGVRRKARKVALEALVEGYGEVYSFATKEYRGTLTHTPEQIRLLLDL